MKIVLMPNTTRPEAKNITIEICKILKEFNTECYLDTAYFKHFDKIDVVFEDYSIALPKCDAVIAVGGDGSIIHAAKEAVKYRKPILGINAGRLAFMAGLEDDELNLLSKLIDGDYVLDRRHMLKTEVYKGENLVSKGYALNDCFITNEEKQRMSDIEIALNGNVFNCSLCDGIILATPTGSTAYSLSAGGPVVDPELESIIYTPVCPHSLFGRSIIFKPQDIITVSSGEKQNLYYSNDGASPVKITGDCKIVISSADLTADFIRIKSDNFIDILYKKLAQGR